MRSARSAGSGDLQVATWMRKRNRLERDAYVGARGFMVTATTSGRHGAFVDASVVGRCVEMLTEAAQTCGFSLCAYCFMPDHCHLLVQGSEESDLADFMKRFKQRSAFAYKQTMGKALWQKGYHDHLIRSEDDEQESFWYIMQNPVKAGLVDNIEDYPFLGGAWTEGLLCADLKVAATGRPGRP